MELVQQNWLQKAKKLLLYLLLILIGLIFLGPFLWMVGVAFMSGMQYIYTLPPSFIPKPPVLDNLINAWTVIPYGKYMLNSFIILGIMLPAHIRVAALASYPLARMNFPG